MVLQWLQVLQGNPVTDANGITTGTSRFPDFSMSLTKVNDFMEQHTANVFGAGRPYFVAFGVGAAALMGASVMWETSKGICSYLLAKPLHLGLDLRKLGDWAVVTGANVGIGRAYCLELAARGLNVVLIGRDQKGLEVAAQELQDIYHVKTKIILTDLAESTMANYQNILAQLQGLDIGVLVNNAGVGPENPKRRFLDSPPDPEGVFEQISVNVSAVVMMTRLILPQMVLKKQGCIINIASVHAKTPSDGAAIYCGSKRFIEFFTLALQDEYRHKGIVFQCVMPGPVLTKMLQDSEKNTFFEVKPEDFVPPALAQAGLRSETFGHWKHAIYMKRKYFLNWLHSLCGM